MTTNNSNPRDQICATTKATRTAYSFLRLAFEFLSAGGVGLRAIGIIGNGSGNSIVYQFYATLYGEAF